MNALRTERDVIVERDLPVESDTRRSLRWGPILAGLVTAFSVFVLLSLLAVGIGVGTRTADGADAGPVASLVASIIALVSFFLGGFVAAWSAGVVDRRRGALDGFLVWAVWLVLLLVAGGLGLGQLFGEAGGLIDDIRTPDLSREEMLDVLSTGALGTFLGLTLAATSAALGGVIGTHDTVRRRLGDY